MRLLFGLLLLAAPALAQDPDTERQRVKNLLLELQAEIDRTDDVGLLQQTYAQLLVAREQLLQTDHQACVAFSRAVHEQSRDERGAFRRALQDCQTPADLPIVEFAFEIYRNANNARGALDRALKVARLPQLRGRLGFLKFVFKGWRGAHDERGALKRAVAILKEVPRSREGCFRMGFETHRKSASEASALRRARDLCR
jgi:hypothetical protein